MCIYACMNVCIYVCTYVCMHICKYLSTEVRKYVCVLYIFYTFACKYVRMHECI